MSGREWQPGDVAMVTCADGIERIALADTEWYADPAGDFPVPTWLFPGGRRDGRTSTARRLAVIDPEDRAQVERLCDLMWARGLLGSGVGGRCVPAVEIAETQAALREFAQPRPVKPEEPLGLGAVVEDATGVRWTRADLGPSLQWAKSDNQHGVHGWADYEVIDVVRVLSEGVTE